MKARVSPKKVPSKTVRRSVALPRQLIEEVTAVAPPELRQNLNRLVAVALQQFATQQKARAFEKAIAQMAKDPAIQAECAAISRDFTTAEADGLKDDELRPDLLCQSQPDTGAGTGRSTTALGGVVGCH